MIRPIKDNELRDLDLKELLKEVVDSILEDIDNTGEIPDREILDESLSGEIAATDLQQDILNAFIDAVIETVMKKVENAEIRGELEKESSLKKANHLDRIDKLFNELVPDEDPADTEEGEMIRAISEIGYRFFNDGDVFNVGYGIETVGPAYEYLKACSSKVPGLRDLLENWKYSYSDEEYKKYLEKAVNLIADYVESKKGNYTPNKEDMYDYSEAAIEEFGDPYAEEEDYEY